MNSDPSVVITLHPKLNKGETFLGNQESNKIPEDLIHIEGLRLAQPAYDITGLKLPRSYWALIASVSAASRYNTIREAQLSAICRGESKRHTR